MQWNVRFLDCLSCLSYLLQYKYFSVSSILVYFINDSRPCFALTYSHSFHLPMDTFIYKMTTHWLGQQAQRETLQQGTASLSERLCQQQAINPGLPSNTSTFWLCHVCRWVFKRDLAKEEAPLYTSMSVGVCLSKTATGFFAWFSHIICNEWGILAD